MFRGRLMAIMQRRDQASIDRIPQMMAGLSENENETTPTHEEVNP